MHTHTHTHTHTYTSAQVDRRSNADPGDGAAGCRCAASRTRIQAIPAILEREVKSQKKEERKAREKPTETRRSSSSSSSSRLYAATLALALNCAVDLPAALPRAVAVAAAVAAAAAFPLPGRAGSPSISDADVGLGPCRGDGSVRPGGRHGTAAAAAMALHRDLMAREYRRARCTPPAPRADPHRGDGGAGRGRRARPGR